MTQEATTLMRRKQDLTDAYKRLFETPDGELVLEHLMKISFIFSTTMVVGDSHLTAMNEGQRRLVLSIMKQLNLNHNKLNQIAKELEDENK